MRTRTPVAIQERDLRILRGFLESRVMTHTHVAALFFSGRVPAAKKRLQKLKLAGLLSERPRRTFDRAVLHLSKAALRLLRNRGILDEYPPLTLSEHEKRAHVSDLTIRHELEVMDVKASVCTACANLDGIAMTEFITWPQLVQFECAPCGAPLLVKPDGLLRICKAGAEPQSARSFYLELDRSTETQATLLLRANCYLTHLKSGGFAVQNGMRRADSRRPPFRVLFVFKSAERRNNVIEALIKNNPSILTPIWLATFADATRDPLGSIWIRPIDFRDALASFSDGSARRHRVRGYRRNRERDLAVERFVPKRRLLD